jgi:hypothetical protein
MAGSPVFVLPSFFPATANSTGDSWFTCGINYFRSERCYRTCMDHFAALAFNCSYNCSVRVGM